MCSDYCTLALFAKCLNYQLLLVDGFSMNVLFLPDWHHLRRRRRIQSDSCPSCRAAGTSSAVMEHQKKGQESIKRQLITPGILGQVLKGVYQCCQADFERNQVALLSLRPFILSDASNPDIVCDVLCIRVDSKSTRILLVLETSRKELDD